MPRIEPIKNAVFHLCKCGSGERNGMRRSERRRKLSVHRKIQITSAHVSCLRSKDSSAASIAGDKEQFTHGQVREMAEWLVEAIAKNDLETATYALKACLVLPWPRGISLALCQEVLNHLSKGELLDWEKPLAKFCRMTGGYPDGKRTEFAADVAFAGQWLLDRYKHLTGRDPLLSHPPGQDDHLAQCWDVLDEPGETFTTIRSHLAEQRRPKISGEQVDGSTERLEASVSVTDAAQKKPFDRDCERIRTFITALKRLSVWANEEGVDAVAFLANELNSQPDRIRNGYVRLYIAVDTALTRIAEDDPTCQAPEYYNLARDLVMKLQIASSDPDEGLIEAARYVMQPPVVKQRTDRTAEIDDALARLVNLTEERNRNADRAGEARQSSATGRSRLVRTKGGKLPRPMAIRPSGAPSPTASRGRRE
jgi:hypothetical protein